MPLPAGTRQARFRPTLIHIFDMSWAVPALYVRRKCPSRAQIAVLFISALSSCF
jgi:hypothetical protein